MTGITQPITVRIHATILRKPSYIQHFTLSLYHDTKYSGLLLDFVKLFCALPYRLLVVMKTPVSSRPLNSR